MEKQIARSLDLSVKQVRGALTLLDNGNTVPFIARYRKEKTGNLDEVQIREVARRAEEIRRLEDRRRTILKSIEEQGKLSEELREKIELASTQARLEDLYAPYRPRRMTRAKKAREAGLEPVARQIEDGKTPSGEGVAGYRCDAFPTHKDVVGGARDILAEEMADDAAIRDHVRNRAREQGRLVCSKRRGAKGDPTYRMYTDFSASVGDVKPHQILAIRRGEKEKELSAGIELDEKQILSWIILKRVRATGPARQQHAEAIEDGFRRLLLPAIERDIRGELERRADKHAIGVFAVNLRNLLMQPPMPARTILGIDPGLRTGCKMAVIAPTGELIETGRCWVHDGRRDDAPDVIRGLIRTHDVELVAIGNGTGSRETETVVGTVLQAVEGIQYAIVNEAGASVYSASELARDELPDLDVSMRGAISIARRLQDPLAELVKIDPKSIGVGMYQHDVDQTRLEESLEAVVEDVVNSVGVDLNSASEPLLSRVAGIGPTLAGRIVSNREREGGFDSRQQLKEVEGLGPKTFQQCAGFLRIREGIESLDNTGIHPENYQAARAVLEEAGAEVGDQDLDAKLSKLQNDGRLDELAERFNVGSLTMADIREGLLRPGRDPRDELDPPTLRSDVLTLDDLREGMILKGTVRNVVDFGAFVDIGVKEDGLVHISEMADRYVESPYEEVKVGDQVDVVVLSVDAERGRIALSIKQVNRSSACP